MRDKKIVLTRLTRPARPLRRSPAALVAACARLTPATDACVQACTHGGRRKKG